MRDAAVAQGADPSVVEPLVPVDLVVDHSIKLILLDPNGLGPKHGNRVHSQSGALRFCKWGQQAFDTFSVVPPGIGIVHQVNLEYLAKGVLSKDGIYQIHS